MNTNNGDQQLKAAAQEGDIDLLYKVIQDDPTIFERIDSKPFVENPLHIAASMGHLQFATEIMMLKPSFALKLNQHGYSPIHLAMQNGQKAMVYRLLNINKELVKVQGRECLTPLHFASQVGEVELLADFLFACPESIEYLTVRCETALHIAVKNEQYEALQVLVGWLKTNKQRGAVELEKKILNQKDEAGNTILHISALRSKLQTRLLVKTWINLKAKNLENKTAVDIATTAEIKKILVSAGAKPGSQVTDDTPTRAHTLRSNTSILEKVVIFICRNRRDMSEEQRNTWLIVATLVATATYQSALSPVGGVYQANASDNNMNTTSFSNSTVSIQGNAGKSVLSKEDFIIFSFLNILSILVSTIAIFVMIPSGTVGCLVSGTMGWFVLCYLFSMERISPTDANYIVVNIATCSVVFVLVVFVSIAVCSRLQHKRNGKKPRIE